MEASVMEAGLCCDLVNGGDRGGDVCWNGGGVCVLVCWVLAEWNLCAGCILVCAGCVLVAGSKNENMFSKNDNIWVAGSKNENMV
jgi:hypothetical protein